MLRRFPVSIDVKGDRGFTAVITTDVLDRYGEVIDPAGVFWGKSIPVLWQHSTRDIIGRTETIVRDGDRILAAVRLANKGVDPIADKADALIRDKVITAVSVGVVVHEWKGNRATKSELVELSAVSLPANTDAETLDVKAADQEGALIMDKSGVVSLRAPAVHTRGPRALPGGERRWSFGAALAAVLEERNPGVDTGYEKEVPDELVHRGFGPKRGGFMVPYNGMMQRDSDLFLVQGEVRRKQVLKYLNSGAQVCNGIIYDVRLLGSIVEQPSKCALQRQISDTPRVDYYPHLAEDCIGSRGAV